MPTPAPSVLGSCIISIYHCRDQWGTPTRVSTESAKDATRVLLSAGRDPDQHHRGRLFEILYGELRRQARLLMGRERGAHTLSPTALVHEAYIRLIDQTRVDGADRTRFLCVAARAMRQILIEHARARDAQKRGRGWKRVTIETAMLGSRPVEFDALVLNDALEALAREDERAAAVTEMRVFGGLTHDEIGEVLGVSRRTVDGDWAYARKWLSREMKG